MADPPTVSLIVVAHNEEKYIGRCLASLMRQTRAPDELLVVAHNCTDRTREIIKTFPAVRLVTLAGPSGTIYARMCGFKEARGEWLAWIDADSYAESSWLETLLRPLTRPEIAAVTNTTLFYGNAFIWLATRFYFYGVHGTLEPAFRVFRKVRALTFWGTSFACRAADVREAGGLAPLLSLEPFLPSPEWLEDYYLSLLLAERGKILLVKDTVVRAAAKQRSSFASIRRFLNQQKSERLIARFVTEGVVPLRKTPARPARTRPKVAAWHPGMKP